MPSHAEKVRRFRELHERSGSFILANAWNRGSARSLGDLGFEAIGTTSAGLALDLGVEDGEAGLEQTILNARAIAEATDLPVSVDFENGFGSSPDACAHNMLQLIGCGAAGASIEDAMGDPDEPIYPIDVAVARVRSVMEAVRGAGSGFVVTARAENFGNGRKDLEDTIVRLKAFADAGADVLFAPHLPDYRSILSVCEAVSKPVNVLMGLHSLPLTASDL